MRAIRRNTSSSRATKRVLGRTARPDARGSRVARTERYVISKPLTLYRCSLLCLEVALLVDDTKSHHDPEPAEKQLWEDQQKIAIQQQLLQKAKAKEEETQVSAEPKTEAKANFQDLAEMDRRVGDLEKLVGSSTSILDEASECYASFVPD